MITARELAERLLALDDPDLPVFVESGGEFGKSDLRTPAGMVISVTGTVDGGVPFNGFCALLCPRARQLDILANVPLMENGQ